MGGALSQVAANTASEKTVGHLPQVVCKVNSVHSEFQLFSHLVRALRPSISAKLAIVLEEEEQQGLGRVFVLGEGCWEMRPREESG